MSWLSERRRRKDCPHSWLMGAYGDAANHTPHNYRLFCRDCGRYLDGPVKLVEMRRAEWMQPEDLS